MLLNKVRVDGAEFFLAEGQDIDQLQGLIVAAVRQGGDFVVFATIGRGPVSVLCTPGIPVRFETVERTDEQIDQWEEDPPPLDIDY